jgi:hypothetical protein
MARTPAEGVHNELNVTRILLSPGRGVKVGQGGGDEVEDNVDRITF